LAIKGKAGQAERANEDLYKDIVDQTVTLQEQNVRLALERHGRLREPLFRSSLLEGVMNSLAQER